MSVDDALLLPITLWLTSFTCHYSQVLPLGRPLETRPRSFSYSSRFTIRLMRLLRAAKSSRLKRLATATVRFPAEMVLRDRNEGGNSLARHSLPLVAVT